MEKASQIVFAVSRSYKIPMSTLTSRSREGTDAFARQVAMYLAWLGPFDRNFTHTAEFFNRDRATVRYAVRRIQFLRGESDDFDEYIEKMVQKVVNNERTTPPVRADIELAGPVPVVSADRLG